MKNNETAFNYLLKQKEKILKKQERKKNKFLKKIKKRIKKEIKRSIKKQKSFILLEEKIKLEKKNISLNDILNLIYKETNYCINDFFKTKEDKKYISEWELVNFIVIYTDVKMHKLFIEYGKELYGK